MTAYGLNLYRVVDNPAQYFLNAFKCSPFWQLSTTTSGSGSTNNENLLNIDANGNPVSLSTGWDGSTLGTNLFANTYLLANVATGSFTYPDGTNSWTLQFNGRGGFTFFRDITTSSSGGLTTTTSGTTVSATSSVNGMGVAINSTGFSSAATFASGGTTVTMTGSNFAAGSPVTFLNSGGALPSPLTSLNADGTATVYYVLASGLTANTFSIATTAGGSPITFASAGTGTHTGFGDWVRDIALVRTTYLSRYNAGEIWNPDWVNKFAGLKCLRFMQTMNTYSPYLVMPTITFTSGSPGTVNWTAHGMRPGQTVTFQPGEPGGGTLPTELTANHTYYVLSAGFTANTFRIASTQGGTAINLATAGSGTLAGISQCVLAAEDIMPATYLFAAPSYNSLCGKGFDAIRPEDIVDLCYRIGGASGCDAFVNFPPLSDTTYATTLAQRMHAKMVALGCSFRIFTEHGNETWSVVRSTLGSVGGNNICTGYSSRAHELFTTESIGSNDSIFTYGIYAGIKNGSAFRTAWTGAGGSAASHKRVLGGQQSNDAYLFDTGLSNGVKLGLAYRNAADNGGNASYWTGYSGTNFDAVCYGGYFGVNLPDAWTADADGGIGKFYQEYNSGGLLLTSASAATTTGGTSTAFTATIGGASNSNQQVIKITFHTTPGASPTLSLNGGAAIPLQDRVGAAINSGWAGTWQFCYTDHTSNGAISACWRQQDLGYTSGNGSGILQQALDWISSGSSSVSTYNSANATSLIFISYECGQSFSDFAKADSAQDNFVYATNRSNEMATLYTTFFSRTNAAGFTDVVCHYCDMGLVVPNNQGSFFGLLESVMQTTLPKYAAYMALLNLHRGGKGLRKF